MDNHEFDNALRDFVKSSELPYDSLQWDKMASRLKAHEERKVLPLPVPATGKAVPVYKWMAGAAAACMLVMLGWFINDLQDKADYTARTESRPLSNPINNSVNATSDHEPEPAQEAPATGKEETIARTPRNAAYYRNAAQAARPEHAKESLAITMQAKDSVVKVHEETPVIAGRAEPVKEQVPVRTNVLPTFDIPHEEEQRQTQRKMAYGVNGGYNIGNGKGNFTVGVNVQRKLGKKVLLETGIAYVSASTQTYEERVSYTTVTGGSGLNTQNVKTTSYEPVKNELHYIQAAPSLSYMLVPGLSAGGGVDAQRLLTKASESVQINNLGGQEPSQPQWDFGVTARMDYQVIKKLKAGLMYRESVGAVSKDGKDAAKRNYLLMQLSYTLF